MKLITLRAKWLAPLIFFEFYLALTIILFFFGPWPWGVEQPVLLSAYLVAAQVFIGIGYIFAWKRVKQAYKVNASIVNTEKIESGIIFLKRALFVTFVLLIPTSLSRTGNVLPDLVAGLRDPGSVYNLNFARLEEGNTFVLVEYLRILLSPLLVGVYPLTIVYWSSLSIKIRFLCVVAIFFNLSLYLATGTNKGIADFVITLPWLIFLGVSAGVLILRIHRSVLVGGALLMFAAFLVFFGMGQTQREGGVGERGVFNTGFDLITADTSNAFSKLLSDEPRIIYESLTRYVGQGYYALSMSFDIEHSSTLGFGNSIFLARNADSVFATNKFTATSIPGLLEEQTGWGMFTLWHSIYPWLASDFGFLGALFVLGLFSYLFAISWGYSLITLSPKWIVLAYLMIILFYYIPANNQVFQSGETCFAVLILIAGFIIRKASSVIVLSRPA